MNARDLPLLLFVADVVIGTGWVVFSMVLNASMIIKPGDKLVMVKRASAGCAAALTLVGLAAAGSMAVGGVDLILCATMVLMSGWGAWVCFTRARGTQPSQAMLSVLSASFAVMTVAQAVRAHDHHRLVWMLAIVGGGVVIFAVFALASLVARAAGRRGLRAAR